MCNLRIVCLKQFISNLFNFFSSFFLLLKCANVNVCECVFFSSVCLPKERRRNSNNGYVFKMGYDGVRNQATNTKRKWRRRKKRRMFVLIVQCSVGFSLKLSSSKAYRFFGWECVLTANENAWMESEMRGKLDNFFHLNENVMMRRRN